MCCNFSMLQVMTENYVPVFVAKYVSKFKLFGYTERKTALPITTTTNLTANGFQLAT